MASTIIRWVAIAHVLAVAAVVLALPGRAADLGGNCCADLEERIAELEATTARKGNRKVSLTVYGTLNKSLMAWGDVDLAESEWTVRDGVKGEVNSYKETLLESGQRVIDNSADPSYVGFRGSAQATPSLTIGYVMEIGIGGHVNRRYEI